MEEATKRSGENPLRARCDALAMFKLKLPPVNSKNLSKFAFYESPVAEKTISLSPLETILSSDSPTVDPKVKDPGYQLFYLNRPSAGLTVDPKVLTPPTSKDTDGTQAQCGKSGDAGEDAKKFTRTIPKKARSNDVETTAGLHLPIFVAEYKKESSNHSTGSNQLRVYLTSAVSFLAAAGIKEQPVFGLATNGALGIVSIAWADGGAEQDFTHIKIAERNAVLFDLTNPLSALNFASFLANLTVNRVDALKERVQGDETLMANLANAINTDAPKTRWSMAYSK